MFRNFKKMAETQSCQKIKVFKTDNKGEYTFKKFNAFVKKLSTPVDNSILATIK